MSEKVENRTRNVLEAALAIAQRSGLQDVTRPRVAAESGLSVGTVSNAFGSMDALRDAVVAAAVEREIVVVVQQGLALRHPVAVNAPPALVQRALAEFCA